MLSSKSKDLFLEPSMKRQYNISQMGHKQSKVIYCIFWLNLNLLPMKTLMEVYTDSTTKVYKGVDAVWAGVARDCRGACLGDDSASADHDRLRRCPGLWDPIRLLRWQAVSQPGELMLPGRRTTQLFIGTHFQILREKIASESSR